MEAAPNCASMETAQPSGCDTTNNRTKAPFHPHLLFIERAHFGVPFLYEDTVFGGKNPFAFIRTIGLFQQSIVQRSDVPFLSPYVSAEAFTARLPNLDLYLI